MNRKLNSFPCSYIPIFGCILPFIFGEDHEIPSEEKENDVGTVWNLAAQKHFRQIQHVRGG
ncbi:hypothetical protein CDL12_20497 [Handroanthus impetiginosus]|uniref:Uncharacterized protein n=1 Tax=Handroanthus impetiginosus TaxID=429701 RepID=A0A2G9GNQ4_9LAMI|nr:hypothetical protein CDL12_20497 [Handroanthus impetiginosus]